MSQQKHPAEQVFAGNSEMARLMRNVFGNASRSHHGPQTPLPLGSLETWPQSLQASLSICLNSRFPIAIYWGADCLLLYNDAWRPIVGDKHPWALGRPAREVWSEIWDTIGPELAGVLATGEGTFHQDDLLSMHRFGYTEECFFEYTFNPIQGQDGLIDGVFNIVSETTYRVLNDRRASLLRQVASRTGIAKTAEEACVLIAEALSSDPADVPFALLYLIDPDGSHACLCSSTELDLDHSISPKIVDLSAENGTDCWSIALAACKVRSHMITDLGSRCGNLPGHPWPESPQEAVVVPITAPGQGQVTGVLVAAASPRRKLDERYQGFFDQVAGQIALAIANARAYEAERQRAEALAELDRAKTTFFSNISHEFRTPLTLMLGPLEETLSNPTRLEASDREQLETVYRNSQRLLKLVNTLLDFSRIEAGRMQAVYQPTDLAALTADLAGVFRSTIERAGLRLVVDCSPLAEPAYVDREMWEKIVLNLLSNAFKFTFEGEIAVILRHAPERFELEIRDTGTGIPATDLPRIFERFHRVQGSRGRTYEGSGIGLSLVQELVDLHGGTIQVSSVVDQGTSFTVSLATGTAHLPSDRIGTDCTLTSTGGRAAPYVEEILRWLPPQAKESAASRDAALSSPIFQSGQLSATPLARILLADDNADMRDYVQHLLSPPYEVEAVTDGVAALAAIGEQCPDLVLTDIMMPRLDGFGLLQALRADPQTQALPIILLSARAGEEARIEGLKAGVDDYLTKPFSARELLAQVEANLKLAQLRQEATRREQAQRQAAEAAKAQLESVLSSINDQFIVLDREWRYVYVNDRVVETLGMAQEALLGRSIWEVFPAWVGGEFEWQVQRAAAEHIPVSFECFYPLWNRWFENRAYPSSEGLTIFTTEITERKQAEEQLRQSEKFLQAINETAPNLLYIFDLNQRRNVYLSPQTFSILGVSPTEVQVLDSQLLGQLFHPDDLAQIEQHHDRMRAAQEDDIFTLEYRIKHASGRWLWLSSRDTIFARDQQGKPTQTLGSAIDITDRKQAELMLVEQKQLLELIAIDTPLDECLAAVCHSIAQLHSGIRTCILLADAQGLTFSQSITPDFLPSLQQGVKDLPINDLCIGTCGEAVYRGQPIACADIANDDRWSQAWRDLCVAHGILACYSSPIVGLERSPFGSLMLCFDEARTPTAWEHQLADFGTKIASIALERDRVSLTLRASEAKYRTLFESIDEGFCVVEMLFDAQNRPLDYRFLEINPVFEQQTGLRHAIGKTARQLMPNLEDCWVEIYGQVALSGEPVRFEDFSEAMNRWLDVYACRTGQPEDRKVAIVFKDISDRKTTEQDREQLLAREQAARESAENANRIKDEFLAVVSHELRSPLNPILGWSQLLLRGKLNPEKTATALATIERNAQLQSQLIDDLLDISRILRGKLSLTQGPTDLNAVILAALETVRLAAEAKSVAIQITLSPDVGMVLGDAGRLQQVVWNLLSNAVKFTPQGGQITVTLTQIGIYAQIQVIDTGKGINPDFLPYVFEHFRQEDGATTRKFGGLGLGLAIARQIVEMHGGQISVNSSGEGQGATFTVQLPLVERPALASDSTAIGNGLRGLRILVVDDDPDSRELITFVLEQADAVVTSVASGIQALQVIEQSIPDLIVSDIGMPDIDGYLLMQQIRARSVSEIPAIALTAYAGELDRQQAIAAGFQQHLAKPVTSGTLVKAIATLMSGKDKVPHSSGSVP